MTRDPSPIPQSAIRIPYSLFPVPCSLFPSSACAHQVPARRAHLYNLPGARQSSGRQAIKSGSCQFSVVSRQSASACGGSGPSCWRITLDGSRSETRPTGSVSPNSRGGCNPQQRFLPSLPCIPVAAQQFLVVRVVTQGVPARVETKQRDRHIRARNGKQILEFVQGRIVLTNQCIDES